MKKLLLTVLVIFLLAPQFPNQFIPITHVGPEHLCPKPPDWYFIDWDSPTQIKSYVKNNYEHSDIVLHVMQKESSFDQHARNGNFVGLMQIGPAACKAVGISYKDAKKYPWVNIEAGARYLTTYCVPKGGDDMSEIYRRYWWGPWYDEQ